MTKSTERGAGVRLPPPLTFALAGLSGWLLPGLRLHQQHAVRIGAGTLLLLGGASLGLAALGLFRKTGQDPAPWRPTPELIFQGPYRHTRNPMYLGMTLLTLSVAAFAGRGWIALFAPVALLAVHFTAVLPEEKYLAETFGEPYLSYQAKVRRYL